MKKVSLDTWIQLLGMIGLLGGLIFVGLEMRQSHNIALAAQQQARTQVITDFYNTMTEAGLSFDDITMKINGERRGVRPKKDGLKDLSLEERAAAKNYMYWSWQIAENDFLQYDSGLMDEDIWKAKLAVWEFNYNTCDTRHIFDFMKPFYNEKFTAVILNFDDECVD